MEPFEVQGPLRELHYAPTRSGVGRERPRSSGARRGGIRLLLVVVLAGLLALGAMIASGLFDTARESVAPEGLAPTSSSAAERGSAQPSGDPPPLEVVRQFDRNDGGLVSAPSAAPASYRPDFDGKGSIRGRVLLPSGPTPSPAMKVLVRPSRILRGRERARSCEVEIAAGETEFELTDLPLGGYDLEVEGAGLHGPPQPVLLVKGSADPFVTLAAHPTGFIDGHVRHEDGRPAEGVLVQLEPITGGAARSATTGAGGEYLFADLRDGEYRITFGPPERPLLPARELSFRAPSMQFTPQVIPALVELRLMVLDLDGQPLAGAQIDGYGSKGGQVHATSDFGGEVLLSALPPGKYRLSGRYTDGRRGRLEIELGLDGPREATLHLR